MNMARAVEDARMVAAAQAAGAGEVSHREADDLIYVDTCSNIEGGLVKNRRLLTKIKTLKTVR